MSQDYTTYTTKLPLEMKFAVHSLLILSLALLVSMCSVQDDAPLHSNSSTKSLALSSGSADESSIYFYHIEGLEHARMLLGKDGFVTTSLCDTTCLLIRMGENWAANSTVGLLDGLQLSFDGSKSVLTELAYGHAASFVDIDAGLDDRLAEVHREVSLDSSMLRELDDYVTLVRGITSYDATTRTRILAARSVTNSEEIVAALMTWL